MKQLLMDANVIINFISNCFSNILLDLAKKTNIIISKEVLNEIVYKPYKVDFYLRETIEILNIINYFRVYNRYDKELDNIIKEIEEYANSIYRIKNRDIIVVHRGELELLAISYRDNIKHLATDERILRMLIEEPFSLREVLSRKLHKKVDINEKNLEKFQDYVSNIKIVRSIDIISYYLIKGYFNNKIKNAINNLDSKYYNSLYRFIFGLLFALKSKGCGVSRKEIEVYVDFILKNLKLSN